MITTFLATLNPMLMLFLCMAIGYVISRTKIMPHESSAVLSKLETWVFCPALSFITMARYCTISSLGTHGINVLLSVLGISLAVGIAIPLSGFFEKKRTPRGIYKYALTFGNFGYLGDPIVLALFGGQVLSYYKLFTLPLTVMVYSWGFSVLVPSEEGTRCGLLKKLFNFPLIALLLGILVGVLGLGDKMPVFLTDTLDALKDCMGPVAMLIAGLTVARYGFVSMLKNKKVYVATLLRLVVLPAVIVAVIWGAKELLAMAFGMQIDNTVVYLAFFAYATPLGLNTVVFPEAYGGDAGTGASMAMISHTLCVASIPLLYAVMTMIFGALPI